MLEFFKRLIFYEIMRPFIEKELYDDLYKENQNEDIRY